MYGDVPYLERLKAVDPAVPAEQGEEVTAALLGSQPKGDDDRNTSDEGEQPPVGDGNDWLKLFEPEDAHSESEGAGWVEVQMVESQTKSVATGIPRAVNRLGPKGCGVKLRQCITCITMCRRTHIPGPPKRLRRNDARPEG